MTRAIATLTLIAALTLLTGCQTANLIHRQVGAVVGPQLTADLQREREIAADFGDELLLQCVEWKLVNLPKVQALIETPTIGPNSEFAKLRETKRMFAAGSPFMTSLEKACGPVGGDVLHGLVPGHQ